MADENTSATDTQTATDAESTEATDTAATTTAATETSTDAEAVAAQAQNLSFILGRSTSRNLNKMISEPISMTATSSPFC